MTSIGHMTIATSKPLTELALNASKALEFTKCSCQSYASRINSCVKAFYTVFFENLDKRIQGTDGPPACVLCKSSGHTANYLGCPRAPKRENAHSNINNNKTLPPPVKPRRAERPRAVTQNLSYAKATAGLRKDPSTNIAPSENIKALMSVISIIDIGEIVLLTNKFKAAANLVEKILILAEYAPLVEAIKNSKI
ncbi:hypothetical protein EVAR_99018_1 [Eumeta japonica]|uniref:Nucleic-acid-binding protein from transposon X-element n=1 Tax=Eumeta variegata TaxID=151549 RepID=A0A4C1XYQ8_EUMVA|nr:hypothetical protein EVAR_99018_1 [Eumeta japonica]